MTRLATLCLLLTGTACGTHTSGIAEGDTAVEDAPVSDTVSDTMGITAAGC